MLSAADIIRDSIIEFSRLQKWMLSVKDKDPNEKGCEVFIEW